MKMVSLKRSQTETEEAGEPAECEPSMYPWGMCLWLDTELISKLGFKSVEDFTIGQIMDLVGKAKVTGISMRQHEDGTNTQTVDLQITDLGLGSERKTVGDTLYGK